MISNLLNTTYGRIIISIILGFGLGALFRKTCNKSNCYIYKAPKLEDINGKSYKYGDKCFKYKLTPGLCSSNKRLIDS